MLHRDFDWREPNYPVVFQQRLNFIAKVRQANSFDALKLHYKNNPADFISDFGITEDPRNAGSGDKPAYLPFVLFPKQIDWINWVVARWKNKEFAVTEKSRDVGMSWLSVSLACTLCIFNENISIGFGSRKAEYVDFLGSPRALFYKARVFMSNLPKEFRAGWLQNRDAPYMRLSFPATKSHISGESGDNIGRGDRSSIYFVDEAAFLERPQLVEASLSQTTNCRIDVSSANGTANPFYAKRSKWIGTDRLFTFHWRDDPRKSDEWYNKQVETLDPVVVASEIDIDYTASVEGILIPQAWVQAAVDAHKKLGFKAEGAARAALDVADQGGDKNAFIGGTGRVVQHARQWSGKTIDLFQTTANCFGFCDDFGYSFVSYDADGVGSGIAGDARIINQGRDKPITVEPYRGSGGVLYPEREDEPGRYNKDFFANRKAQEWWHVRKAFERTWKAVTKGVVYNADQLISLDSEGLGSLLPLLCQQLSQPTFTRNEAGKIVIDKLPDGAKSPDLGDGVVIWNANPGDQYTVGTASIEEGEMVIDGKAVALPDFSEVVYAVVHNSGRPGKDNAGTAVTYWNMPLEGYLYCFGWDYTDAEGAALDQWLSNIFTTLGNASEATRLGSLGIFLSDEGQNGVIREKAASFGDASLIEGKITEMDARGQAMHISGHVKNVRLTNNAVDYSCSFRGSSGNHLLKQVRKFTADTKDVEDMTVLRSFVYGVSIALEQEG